MKLERLAGFPDCVFFNQNVVYKTTEKSWSGRILTRIGAVCTKACHEAQSFLWEMCRIYIIKLEESSLHA